MLGDDDLVAQTRTVGDVNLKLLLLLLLLFIEHLIIGVQTGLTLSVTGFRCHTHPLQLTLQRLTALRSLLLLLGQTLWPDAVTSVRAKTNSCLSREYPHRGRVRESTQPHHRGSNGRG